MYKTFKREQLSIFIVDIHKVKYHPKENIKINKIQS